MLLRARSGPFVSLLVLAAACSSSTRAATDTVAAGATPDTPATAATMTHDSAGGMAGRGGRHADTVVERVQRDLATMEAASGDAIVPLVPAHRQTVEALVADCEMMMKQMKMNPPRKWTNAIAALHQDLSTMATANSATLHAMWPEHKQRLQGMLDMRHDMMKM